MLDNLSFTNRTVVDQREQLRRTFTVGRSSATTTADFLAPNEQNLISLAATSRPVLGVFAKYSPEYPCLLDGLTRSVDYEDRVWSGPDGHPGLQLNITVTCPPRNPYVPGDQPQYNDTSGPGLPRPEQHRRDHRRRGARGVLLPDPAERRRPLPDNPVSGNPHCLGGSGPNDVPPGAGNPDAGRAGSGVAATRLTRVGRGTGLRPEHPRLPDRHRPGQGQRSGRLDDGAAAAGDTGDAPVRSLAAPLTKLAIFALVTILASYVLITTITNAGYGEQTPTGRCSPTSPGLVKGDEVRIAGVRVGQVQTASRSPRRRSRRRASRWPR